uniref:Uncharacterized protein n=1 Tax=Leersia perrieri TaxID=77586 RepID=A0A0D9X1Y1_9ORYZ
MSSRCSPPPSTAMAPGFPPLAPLESTLRGRPIPSVAHRPPSSPSPVADASALAPSGAVGSVLPPRPHRLHHPPRRCVATTTYRLDLDQQILLPRSKQLPILILVSWSGMQIDFSSGETIPATVRS